MKRNGNKRTTLRINLATPKILFFFPCPGLDPVSDAPLPLFLLLLFLPNFLNDLLLLGALSEIPLPAATDDTVEAAAMLCDAEVDKATLLCATLSSSVLVR